MQHILEAFEVLIAPAKTHIRRAGAFLNADREVECIHSLSLQVLSDLQHVLNT